MKWFKSLRRETVCDILFYSGGLFLGSIILDIMSCTTFWKDLIVPVVSGLISLACIIQLMVADK